MTTQHPAIAAGCTRQQVAVFEQIAMNNDGGHHPATLAVLERKGLIVGEYEPVYGPGRHPIDRIPIMIRRYHVPLHVNLQWCVWASEQPECAEEPQETVTLRCPACQLTRPVPRNTTDLPSTVVVEMKCPDCMGTCDRVEVLYFDGAGRQLP